MSRSGNGKGGNGRSGNGRNGTPFAAIEDAIREFAAGRFLIVVDDEDRENEGDLTIAAEKVTPAAINFMARYGRGLICMPMTEERLEDLDIPLMVKDNTSPYNTAFCVSIEAKRNVSTGISAADRAHTVKVAIDPRTRRRLANEGVVAYSTIIRDGRSTCAQMIASSLDNPEATPASIIGRARSDVMMAGACGIAASAASCCRNVLRCTN